MDIYEGTEGDIIAADEASQRVTASMMAGNVPEILDIMLLACGLAFRRGSEMGYHSVTGMDLDVMTESFARGLRHGKSLFDKESAEGQSNDC